MEMIKSVLVRNMKAFRKAKGWNQDVLAEKTGYSTGFIKEIERGASWVSPEALEKICEAFDVSYDKMFSSATEGRMLALPMSRAIQKLMNVPDKVYDLAEKLGPNHEIWEHIEDILSDEIEHGEKDKKKADHA